MNSSFVLDYLSQKTNQVSKTIEWKEKKKLQWWQILVNVLLGIVSIAIEVVASAFLGPVAGMIVGVAADVVTNIAGDYVMEQNPWSAQNIVFNVVLPLAAIPAKATSISKIAKNSVNTLSDAMKNKQLKKLAWKLQNISMDNVDDVQNITRKYQSILNDIGLTKKELNGFKIIDELQIKKIIDSRTIKINRLKKINQALRKTNKAISYLADPNLAQKSLARWVSKSLGIDEVFGDLNKKIIKFKKTIYTKVFKNNKRNIQKILIPLNHTKSPWISGIKLYPVKGGVIHYYHVIIIFNKLLTNGKKPVTLYNKAWKNIYQFITSPSAGKYYINNIAWGWDIGRMIRQNSLLLAGVNFIPFLSQYNQTLYLSSRIITKVATVVDKFVNGTYLDDLKKSFSLPNIFANTIYGFAEKLPAKQLIKTSIRTLETKKISYVEKYATKKAKKIIYRAVKNKWNNIGSNQQGEIGYGKYRYQLSKK